MQWFCRDYKILAWFRIIKIWLKIELHDLSVLLVLTSHSIHYYTSRLPTETFNGYRVPTYLMIFLRDVFRLINLPSTHYLVSKALDERRKSYLYVLLYRRPLEKHVFAIKYAYAMTGWIKQGKRQARALERSFLQWCSSN